MRNTASETYHDDDDNDSSDSENSRAHELRLWPPPRLQAYCLDHFLIECEIYHEQENDRYTKLVAHSRESFKRKSPEQFKPVIIPPTRRQPSRRAKDKHAVIGAGLEVETQTREVAATLSRGPPRPRRLSSAPFKPAKLEKAFKESQQGAMVRILTGFYKKLELHKNWTQYRSLLLSKVQELVDRLKTEAENKQGRPAHANCVFRGPLGVECRYCGFVDLVHEDEAVTPRKLAPPAAMRAIRRLSESEDSNDPAKGGSRLTLRGTDIIVDVCNGNTMIVLVNLKGILELCAKALEDENVVLASPTTLSTRMTANQESTGVTKAGGVKRGTGESDIGGGRKRRKSGAEARI
ncbi:hypothetical protein F5Y08DRAFT_348288 [Xylaria arbuscula]|nr:hypothetical protein F5Y08DRAFT_348288 [Xylaria arbuscula]